jgi:hypothetical protein
MAVSDETQKALRALRSEVAEWAICQVLEPRPNWYGLIDILAANEERTTSVLTVEVELPDDMSTGARLMSAGK